jgi:hypothetical protein
MVDLSQLDEDFLVAYSKVRVKALENGLNINPYRGFINLFDHAERWRSINSDSAIMSAVIELEMAGSPFLSEVLSSAATGRTLTDWNPKEKPGFDWHNWGEALDVVVKPADPFATEDVALRKNILADIAREEGLFVTMGSTLNHEIVHIQCRDKNPYDVYGPEAVDAEMYRRYKDDHTNG